MTIVTGTVESAEQRQKKDGSPFWVIKMGGIEYAVWDRLPVWPAIGDAIQLDAWQRNDGKWNVNTMQRDKVTPNPAAINILGNGTGGSGGVVTQGNVPPLDVYPEAHTDQSNRGTAVQASQEPPQRTQPTPPPAVPLDRTRVSIERQVAAKIAAETIGGATENWSQFEALADRVYAWISSPPKT